MKVNANTIRPGNTIEHQNRLWRVVSIQHTQPGKGGAYIQTELKDVRDGTKLNERFRSSEALERVRLDEKEYQYLYLEGDNYVFMDQESYEQLHLNARLLTDTQIAFLKEGLIVTIETYEEEPIGLSLPEQLTLEITEADAVVKGQTAASSYKPAILENGIRVMVPPYIASGERIVVNTETLEYVERAR